MDNSAFGLRLKGLRASKAKTAEQGKVTQQDAADYLNISVGAYASWESGRTKPDLTWLPKIADYYGVTIDDLLGYRASGQASLDLVTPETDLKWSLLRAPRTENERKGLEVWQRLTQEESFEKISAALKSESLDETKRYLMDVIYTDLISIDHLPKDVGLANDIRKGFGLREVVVLPISAESPSLFRYILLGEAARSYFKAHVYKGMKVGLAGGYSVSRLIFSLRPGDCPPIEVYPLVTSPVVQAVALDANTLVGALEYRQYWHGVRGFFLQYASPLDWKKANGSQQFMPTRRILAKAKAVDIAFMGLGIIDGRDVPVNWLDELLESEGLSLKQLRDEGAVGDILYHMVKENGQPLVSKINDFVCSIELEDLQNMVSQNGQVVAIASGKKKTKIIKAAIEGGYVNVLIIDDELAHALTENMMVSGDN